LNYYNYFTEIEETFVRRRGKNLLLSPLDWALIESWQEREVPLHIVLRGIERVFDVIDKQPNRKRSVKSLFYCKEEIEAQFAEWLETQVGKEIPDSAFLISDAKNDDPSGDAQGEMFSREAVEAHLEEVSSELAAALRETSRVELRETFERVLSRVTALRNSDYESAEKLEESLEKLDALIDEGLLQHAVSENLRAETTKNLAAYRHKMETEAYERTFNLMILKKLREEAKVPRFSLFYL
jgi:hypothetical protein